MTFDEVLAQVQALLQQEKRVSYRALKLRFSINDDYIEGLKDELIHAKRVAVDEEGKVLVWAGTEINGEKDKGGKGEKEVVSSQLSVASPPPLAERRQLTVMFCDLVGSTALSERLDPEELREVVRGYQETCTEVIQRYDGHIAQHLGDGLLVYFGYPVAHEDDAARAVRAGLDIIQALQRFSVPSPVSTGEGQGEGQLHIRIGIHTGLVVIGEIGSSEKREILALGETPNIAARLQGLAEPDTVVLSAVTQRLVSCLFECRELGPQTLKGISTLLSVYQVVGESTAQSRFDVAVRKGLTPLVGREEELGLLRRRWEQAKTGNGQVVLLSGEPGIGKSRLVQALTEHILTTDGAIRIEFRCSPYHQNSALYPIIDHLQRLLQFVREDSSEAKLKKLENARVGAYGHTPLQSDAVPLLAALLSLPHPTGYPPITVSPQKQKEKTQAALVAWLVEEAEQKTVYTIWEDLHWADPSTLEVLTLFLEQIPTSRVFSVLTFRPEFTPPWNPRSYLTQLTLSRLGQSQVEAMVEQVTDGNPLPKEVVQQIVSKTDGVPLFVEELTKSVVEAVEATGRSPLQSLDIPATLQDSLMARLDRLGPAKEVAQLGATIGREFSYELLQAVSSIDEEGLQHGLKQLVEAELVYQRGVPPQATYLFKHALIQDTANQSLLKSTRQQYHRQIAKKLEEQFPQTAETQPELLAHHYTEAGLIAQAIPYWQRAGQKAIEHSANIEAIVHLSKGLELLKTLPDTPERAQQELTLQIALGVPLLATKGYAAPEVGKTYTRARELCQQVQETPQVFPALRGLWAFYLTRAEYATAHELGKQFLTLAQNTQDSGLLVEAHFIVGFTLTFLGEFVPARIHSEQGVALYDFWQHRSLASLFGADPGMDCLHYAAWTLWSLGYPDQAFKRSHESLTLAQELSHPYSLGLALTMTARFHQYRREEQKVRERAEAAIALSSEQGFMFWSAWSTILRGWALVEQGREEEGIAQIHQGMAAFRARGGGLSWSHFLALLAEAYGKVGQTEEGLSALSEALILVNKTGERFYEAELYRLKGELLLTQEGFRLQAVGFREKTQEVEGCFLTAIDIAQKQQAKSLELRATVSLARLWQQQGKQREAHRMLADIYNWFTEGFDTRDLQEAKALLDELQP